MNGFTICQEAIRPQSRRIPATQAAVLTSSAAAAIITALTAKIISLRRQGDIFTGAPTIPSAQEYACIEMADNKFFVFFSRAGNTCFRIKDRGAL